MRDAATPRDDWSAVGLDNARGETMRKRVDLDEDVFTGRIPGLRKLSPKEIEGAIERLLLELTGAELDVTIKQLNFQPEWAHHSHQESAELTLRIEQPRWHPADDEPPATGGVPG
jgi:hypothetical protein